VLVAGALLATACGLANAAAATLEKREGRALPGDRRGLALLAGLARRPWWLVAMGLSLAAWVSESAALALAPVPVVTTLRSAGRAGLVASGVRYLDERFRRAELAAVAVLTAAGILVAVASAHVAVRRRPLSNGEEVLVAAGALAVAVVLGARRQGLGSAAAAGTLFVATGAFTKEVGDRVAEQGVAAFAHLLATPGPYVMVAFGLAAQACLQDAFQRANAASVSALTAAVSGNGLVVLGFLLYHEPFPAGPAGAGLVAGLLVSSLGTAWLALAGAEAAART
jgi:hypothetical protein